LPRLRQVPKGEVDDELTARMYARLFGDRDPVAEPGTSTGSPGDWWTVSALVPDVLRHAVQGFGVYQSERRHLPPALRELAQTRTGWTVGSRFVFSQHCKSCRALGMDEAKITAIPSWSVSELFDPAERAVLAWTDALVLQHGRVSDDTFAALRSHLADEEILELTYITVLYIGHAIFSRALRTEFDDVDDPITEVPGDHRGLGADLRGSH
jgi:alkylhydroperoxidase family enzyme